MSSDVPPRLVDARQAAEICGVSPFEWERLVAAGERPAPLPDAICGTERWDRFDLRPSPRRARRGRRRVFDYPLRGLEAFSCVYFLFMRARVVYVGQSESLLARVVSHKADKEFDGVGYLPVPAKYRLLAERAFIKLLNPKYNILKPRCLKLSEEEQIILEDMREGRIGGPVA